MQNNSVIPVFFACDERFMKYAKVSLYSLIANSSPDRRYRVYFLHTDIPAGVQEKTREMGADNVEIVFEDVSDYLRSIVSKLPLRDYYSKTTYYRLFIAEMHPEYDKAVYIDSDTIIQKDIAGLYDIDVSDYYLAACHEQAMLQVPTYGEYVEKCVGISRQIYFNAGVLLINCAQFREHNVLERFISVLPEYDFVVTQDEDYLNLICKDHVLFVDQRWNTEIFGEIPYPIEEACVLHYIMFNKPWHYADCLHADVYFKYAQKTDVYDDLMREQCAYTEQDRKSDEKKYQNLLQLAIRESDNENNYLNYLNREKRAPDRVEIVKKIEGYEKEGRFDEDVENDPPSKVLRPEDIDYLHRGITGRVKTRIAFRAAHRLVDKLIEDKKLIIKEIRGIDNIKNLNSGAVITCNHFNAFDSFAVQLVYEASEQKERTFYRVIREGNYTSFPGFYGFLMRHCNTLPLSSDHATMKKFVQATNRLLRDGNFVLIYPEQGMWWNYRKPRPLKDGAYVLAVKNGVPVLPCFITMKDSDVLGDDGFYVQEYTIHVEPPIYPDGSMKYRDAVTDMRNRNFEVWREIYEREYQMPLSYTTEKSNEQPQKDGSGE